MCAEDDEVKPGDTNPVKVPSRGNPGTITSFLKEMREQTDSVSEIEFCTLYVVAERWILGCILRFMHAKNHFSDTLIPRHPHRFRIVRWRSMNASKGGDESPFAPG